MKRYGDSNVIQSDIKSDGFASNQEFNKLVVNNLSEVDQETLDHEVIIFNKEDDHIYTYDDASNSWTSKWKTRFDDLTKVNDHNVIYIDDVKDVYNSYYVKPNQHLLISPDLFDFGPIGSPIDFVIDFWLVHDEVSLDVGTILYNGKNVGQVDLETNKNLLITTRGAELVKDPNYQANPSIVEHPDDDGYLNIMRPRLRSNFRVIDMFLCHVAMIRSGGTTYLAIDGIIHDSAPSVEYFHYDDVLLGAGYIDAFSGGIVNFRVSKNTDRGWTTNFTPPNFNHTVDGNTDFLLDDGTMGDTVGTHTITVPGSNPNVEQHRFPVMLDSTFNNAIIRTNLVQDELVLLPPRDELFNYYIEPDIKFTFIWPNNIRLFANTGSYPIYETRFKPNTFQNIRSLDKQLVFIQDLQKVDFEYSFMKSIYNGSPVNSTKVIGDTTNLQRFDVIVIPNVSRKSFTVIGANEFGNFANHYVDVEDHPYGVRGAADMSNGNLVYDTVGNKTFADMSTTYGWYRPNWANIQFDINLTGSITNQQIVSFVPNANMSIVGNVLTGPFTAACNFQFTPGKWYRVFAGVSHCYQYVHGRSVGHWIYVENLETGQLYTSYVFTNMTYPDNNTYIGTIFAGPYLLSNIVISRTWNTTGSTTSYGAAPIRYPSGQVQSGYMFDQYIRTIFNT